jgi:hypothetical protein
MPRRPRYAPALVVVAMITGAAAPASGQDRITIQADVLIYGDDTEFRNPFREGETIFGSATRVAASVGMNDHVTLSLGIFANQRFGSDEAFRLVRPIVSLTLAGQRSLFVFGTLPQTMKSTGPDRNGPHGLLPALQRETLAFDRPYEAGVFWRFAGARVTHESWIDWQLVNTPTHRERFDAGASGEVRVNRLVALPFQAHIVHSGGQLFASGRVADSGAIATGISIAGRIAKLDVASLEVYGALSRHRPDRSDPPRDRDGAAFLARAAVERTGWRAHLLFWRGCDFIHEEGDPNYLSVTKDGSLYRGTRDYSETGLTRTLRPADELRLDRSARLHRIENNYEYSFRVTAVAALAWPVR